MRLILRTVPRKTWSLSNPQLPRPPPFHCLFKNVTSSLERAARLDVFWVRAALSARSRTRNFYFISRIYSVCAFYILVRVLLVLPLEIFAWSFLVCYSEHKSHPMCVCRGRGGREAKLKNDLSKRKFSIVARTKARGRMLMWWEEKNSSTFVTDASLPQQHTHAHNSKRRHNK